MMKRHMREQQEMKLMNNGFTCLSGENKKKILDITKFLVLTQENIVPAMLLGNTEVRRFSPRVYTAPEYQTESAINKGVIL